jgi:hypothetical protein
VKIPSAIPKNEVALVATLGSGERLGGVHLCDPVVCPSPLRLKLSCA